MRDYYPRNPQRAHSGVYLSLFRNIQMTSRLINCISFAKALGLHTRLVTNGHWANREDIAADKMQAFLKAGLDEINFSTGDEHVKFIPLERVVLATRLALAAKLRTHVMIELKRERAITKAAFIALLNADGLQQEVGSLLSVGESPWMPLDPFEKGDYEPKLKLTDKNLEAHGPCSSVLTTLTIQADGNVGACCGLGMRTIPELKVGTVGDSLSGMQKLGESDIVKLAIHYLGPMQLLKMAAESDPLIQWQGMYAHQCQACARVYRDMRVQRFVKQNISAIKERLRFAVYFDENIGQRFLGGESLGIIGSGGADQ